MTERVWWCCIYMYSVLTGSDICQVNVKLTRVSVSVGHVTLCSPWRCILYR